MVFLQEGRSRRNSFLQDIRKWTPLCTIFEKELLCAELSISTLSQHFPANTLQTHTHYLYQLFPPLSSKLSGYPLRPSSESVVGGSSPHSVCSLIFYPGQNPPLPLHDPNWQGEQCKTYQLAVRTALVPRYFPRQLDMGSLVIPSRLSSPTLLALPAIRRPW